MAFGWVRKIGSGVAGAARKTTGAIAGATRRVTGRERPPTAPPAAGAPPAPPSPPTGPPAPPTGPPPGPGPAGGGEGEGAGLSEEQLRAAEEAAAEAERDEMARKRAARPGSLYVAILGTWKISGTTWIGTIRAHLAGDQVHAFLDAMDKGDQEAAVMICAEVYDDGSGFASQLNYEASTVSGIAYDHSAHGDYDASQDPSIE